MILISVRGVHYVYLAQTTRNLAVPLSAPQVFHIQIYYLSSYLILCFVYNRYSVSLSNQSYKYMPYSRPLGISYSDTNSSINSTFQPNICNVTCCVPQAYGVSFGASRATTSVLPSGCCPSRQVPGITMATVGIVPWGRCALWHIPGIAMATVGIVPWGRCALWHIPGAFRTTVSILPYLYLQMVVSDTLIQRINIKIHFNEKYEQGNKY